MLARSAWWAEDLDGSESGEKRWPNQLDLVHIWELAIVLVSRRLSDKQHNNSSTSRYDQVPGMTMTFSLP